MEKHSNSTNQNGNILTTHYKSVRCTCSSGHRFLDRVVQGIDISTDADKLEELSSWGMPVTKCETCGKDCPTAEPLLLNDPRPNKLALYIPKLNSHREAELRAQTMVALAGIPPDSVPDYCLNFETIVGVGALTAWQYELSEEEHRIGTEGTRMSMSTKPPIHEAFADLIHPERRFTTTPPPPDRNSQPPIAVGKSKNKTGEHFDLTIDPDQGPVDDD